TENDSMRKQSSVTLRAIAFVVIVCICLITIDGWLTWNARSVQLQEMNVATSNLARAIAQETDAIWVGTVERAKYDGTKPTALARLHRLLTMRMAELP